AQLRSLDAGKGEKIPLLSEVLDTVNRRAMVNIELKGPRTAIPVLALLREYIAAGWSPQDFIVSSFRRLELGQLRGSGLRVGVLFARSARRFRPIATRLGAWSVHVPLAHVNPRLVARIHDDGRKVFVYTVNTRAAMERLDAMGVDGFFTDFPDRWTA
ncbi:MAG TPA: glycerophosphodiester phosphodiesterase, partial [Chthoniobacteraceae bacterium]|nr:glycerophosphodiester phosphodiesterase [Chthoniobacteraceae bacterium]